MSLESPIRGAKPQAPGSSPVKQKRSSAFPSYDDDANTIDEFICSYREPSYNGNHISPEARAAADELGEDIGSIDRIAAFVSVVDGPDVAADEMRSTGYIYAALALDLASRATSDAVIRLEDLLLSAVGGARDVAGRAHSNSRRYTELFAEGLERVGRRIWAAHWGSVDDVGSALAPGAEGGDPLDVMFSHRLERERQAAAEQLGEEAARKVDPTTLFPAALRRRFEVRLEASDSAKPSSLRDVRAGDVGHLVRVRCVVTRASEVRPLVRVATYVCDECGYELYYTVHGKSFLPLTKCHSPVCEANGTDGRVSLMVRGSRFDRVQELRVQELPGQVPVGHVPRAMTVVCRGQLARLARPGDTVVLDCVLTPSPYTGYRAIRAGLLAETHLEASGLRVVRGDRGAKAGQRRAKQERKEEAARGTMSGDGEVGEEEAAEDLDGVAPAGQGEDAFADENMLDPSPFLLQAMDEAAEDPQIYSKLARSIAPEIWGHEDVKKALLLMLVGGVTSEQSDGLRIRGDINVCLMGDPGVAKSQLLKHVTTLAPRCVYTTGKGSSGVGLTAAVVKDAVTGELSLEGGALVLADRGICCIDEFDKMEDSDRTAIHEVMEQQTVSIAKAGITTSLHARTAILAAANPVYGRFRRNLAADPHSNLLRNVNLPAALLSRFDLLFLLLDVPDADSDAALARHVTFVHYNGHHPPLDFQPLSPAFLRCYVHTAKQVNPFVPRELLGMLVESFVEMRYRDDQAARQGGAGAGRGVMTARQLLSVLRLAQAHARLEFRDRLQESDVREAVRLVHASKSSVLVSQDGAAGRGGGGEAPRDDWRSRVFEAVREGILYQQAAGDGGEGIPVADVRARALRMGVTGAQVEAALQEYVELSILQMNPAGTIVSMVLGD